MSEKELDSKIAEAIGSDGVERLASGGGCISSGFVVDSDKGKFYVKVNSKPGSRGMFEGELKSLEAINATQTIKAPKAVKVLEVCRDAVLIMTYLELRSLSKKYSEDLGKQLARLHKHNSDMLAKQATTESRIGSGKDKLGVKQYGFDVPTSCGFIPQPNVWSDDWVEFYARDKLQHQLNIIEKEYGDREAISLWPSVMRAIPKLMMGADLTPALIHGDLWSGNIGADEEGPVVFDPASLYAHSEYDLAITRMFGGFSSAFYSGYFSILPKADGFKQREPLYELFHYLNHWSHFGSGYRSQSISLMRTLSKLD